MYLECPDFLSLTGHPRMQVGKAVCNDLSNKDVAYTNGSMIFLNTANELSSGYVTLNAKAACLAGIIAHECAHKLYLDFDGIQEAHKKNGAGLYL